MHKKSRILIAGVSGLVGGPGVDRRVLDTILEWSLRPLSVTSSWAWVSAWAKDFIVQPIALLFLDSQGRQSPCSLV